MNKIITEEDFTKEDYVNLVGYALKKANIDPKMMSDKQKDEFIENLCSAIGIPKQYFGFVEYEDVELSE